MSRDYDTALYHKVGGFVFRDDIVKRVMPAKDLDLQLKWIKETGIRDDDVIICAFPKAGTHWVWEIVNMILRGSAEYNREMKETAMLELCTPEMTSSLSPPRVLNTHLTHDLIPAGIKEKNCKIIHVIRNPKDVAVSYYSHLKTQSEIFQGPDCPPFEEFVKAFRGEIPYPPLCSFTWYIKHWEQFKLNNPIYPLLDLFYEDIIQAPEKEIRKIATFLNKAVDEKLVKEIGMKCNFRDMKQAYRRKNSSGKSKATDGASIIFRKGTVGDWKNYLTVAENEAFDRWVDRELKDSTIKFRYQ